MSSILSIQEGTQSSIHTHNYVVNFLDDAMDVYVTDRTEMVDTWIEDLERFYGSDFGGLIVGLEVTRRHPLTDQVAILQLCVDNDILIFQIFRASRGISQKLRDFLAQESFTFVGVGIQNDVDVLIRDYGLRVRGRILDLSELVTERPPNIPLSDFDQIRRSLRRYIQSVPERITYAVGWPDSRELEPELVMYACIDPYVSCSIGQQFLNASGGH